MPAADTVLLPLCVGLALLGVIATGIAWRRGNKGRVVQGVGAGSGPDRPLLQRAAPAALERGRRGRQLGLDRSSSRRHLVRAGLLGLCVVLWVVGGFVARRSRPSTKAVSPTTGSAAALPAKKRSARNQPPVATKAEIEALLKSRGIE